VPTVQLDPGVRLTGRLLVGGQPLRILRLNEAAAAVVARWREPAVPAPAEEALAARLHAAGLAVLRPDTSGWTPADVTVVVPVRDRPAQLARCLAALDGCRVLVVDDGSRDPAAVAAAARGATLLVRPVNGGPAAARNTGLAAVTTPLVAFVDSDCVVPPGWLDALLPALGDVVAPRVVGAGGPGRLARFEVGSGPLDLGGAAGPVGPGRRVGHLPAAVLLARRAALGAGFDEALRVGEDVDLVWRVTGPVRYEPRVVARHDTRAGARAWWAQRVGYGTSAAALAARHPGRLAPVVLSRWSAPAVALLAARRPGLALAWTAATGVGLWRRLPAAPGRTVTAARLSAAGVGWTAVGLAEAAARPWLPALLAASLVSRRARVVTAVAVAARLHRARGTRTVDRPTWVALRVADDLAYGTGVWLGALRARDPGPLLPRVG
jgi:mycofactocin glycosyltransferase